MEKNVTDSDASIYTQLISINRLCWKTLADNE